MQAAAEAQERFVAEFKEMDAAWANGTLDDWLKHKLDAEKRGVVDGNGSNGGGGGEPAVA